jgi:GGDEF domain-containing protein
MRNAVFKTTFEFRARMIRCNVSIGVSNFPADARDMRELLGVAERNMYRDKDLRRASGTEASV